MNAIDTANLSGEDTASIKKEKSMKKQSLLKSDDLPKQVLQVISITSELFSNHIVGMYLYGSYVLGGLRPNSDIDILIITKEKMSDNVREELTNQLLLCSGTVGCNEKRPLEVTVINRADIISEEFAPKCEYMYGEWLREEIEAGKIPQPCYDDDIVILLWQARAHNMPLQGKRADTVIPFISGCKVRKAIQNSLPGLIANVKGDERNVILTLSRMWFTLETEDICPKDAAAEWVLPKLPNQFLPLIKSAVKGYRGECVDEWNDLENETLFLVNYMKNKLEQMLEPDD